MDLLITLGHNSSCISIKDEDIVGYEQERLDRIKSSSRYPIDAINECLKYHHPDSLDENFIYLSHWFDDYNCHTKEIGSVSKYFNYKHLNYLCQNFNFRVIPLSSNFTHHDAHANSALHFFLEKKEEKTLLSEGHILVADGFGNRQEVLSIYNFEIHQFGSTVKLINRFYGYENSIGLLYQYATSYCGMTENQDEYKFLGYEAKINEILNLIEINNLMEEAQSYTHKIFTRAINSSSNDFQIDLGYINIDYLKKVKGDIWAYFDALVKQFQISKDKLRIFIGFFVQYSIEYFHILLTAHFQIRNLLTSGGVYYNVKLNNLLLNIVDMLCVLPLAGDQGCAIGLYASQGHIFRFGDLCFGKRKLNIATNTENNIYSFDNEEAFYDKVFNLIEHHNMIVNVVSNSLEFGPRSLCNSSTLAKPTKSNSEIINQLNNRTSVMPMAPVLLKKKIDTFFSKNEYSKLVGSLDYMISTLNLKDSLKTDDYIFRDYGGIFHKHPLEDKWSARVQLVDNDKPIAKVLEKVNVDCLINTSFNMHGKPIVFSNESVISDFNHQMRNAHQKDICKPYLLVLNHG